MKLKRYTLEEREEIQKIFSQENNYEQRKQLAKKLGKTLTNLTMKYTYDVKHFGKGTQAVEPNLFTEKKVEPKITHVVQPFIAKSPVIIINDSMRIVMPNNKFTIDGITIEC